MGRFHERMDGRRWAAARRAVFRRAGLSPRCAECGRFSDRLEVDHVVALADSGQPYDPSNLQLLCRSCHIAKHVRDPDRLAWIRLLEK